MIDDSQVLCEHAGESVKSLAVSFVASLPIVFGESLDRMTLWDKIGSALETAWAKTAGDDCDFFISRVLETIQASPAAVARAEEISHVLMALESGTPEMRHAWLSYLATHRYAVLVRARNQWEQTKEVRRNG